MKEKIQLLSRGVFEYENPEIEVSEKEIALEVEAGSHYSGTIQLNSRNHIEIRAMIFSSNKWIAVPGVYSDRKQRDVFIMFLIHRHWKQVKCVKDAFIL